MFIFPLIPGQNEQITIHHSELAFINPIALLEETTSVVCIQLAPGGVLGSHPASGDQLFCVITGQGEVTNATAEYQPIQAGQGVLWRRGEWHTTRSTSGLMALVIEGTLNRFRLQEI